MRVNFVQNLKQEEIEVEISCQNRSEEVEGLIEYIYKYKNSKDTFVVKLEDSYEVIKIAEIESIEVFGNIITITTKDKKIEFKGRLYKVLEELSNINFVQVSKSAVININYLIKLEALFSGMVAVLENGSRVSVSRSYLKELKKNLGI